MLYKAEELFKNMQNEHFRPELFFRESVFVEALPVRTRPVMIIEGGQDKKAWLNAKTRLEDYGVKATEIAEQSRRMNLFITKYERKLKKPREQFDTMTREKIIQEFYKSEGLL